MLAVQRSDAASLQLLLEAKANVNRKVKNLIGLGSPKFIQDAIGQTALHHAAAGPPKLACVSLLVQHGARLRRDTFGCTPLHNAANSPTQATDAQASAAMRLLMSAPNAKAMIDAEAAQGCSALSLAVTVQLKGDCHMSGFVGSCCSRALRWSCLWVVGCGLAALAALSFAFSSLLNRLVLCFSLFY